MRRDAGDPCLVGPHTLLAGYLLTGLPRRGDPANGYLEYLKARCDRYGPGSGKMRLYAGSPPRDHATRLAGQTLLIELPIAFGDPADGVLRYVARGANGLTSGMPSFMRLADARGITFFQNPSAKFGGRNDVDFPFGVVAGLGLVVEGRIYWLGNPT